MSIRLDVPVYRQETPMSCWWACQRMILAYYGRTVSLPHSLNPIFFLPDGFAHMQPHAIPEPHEWPARGVPIGQLRRLGELTGFTPLTERPAPWNAQSTEAALRREGPMWFYGVWNDAPHAIVLTGVDDRSVFINDPNGGCMIRKPIQWFVDRMRVRFGEPGNPLRYGQDHADVKTRPITHEFDEDERHCV